MDIISKKLQILARYKLRTLKVLDIVAGKLSRTERDRIEHAVCMAVFTCTIIDTCTDPKYTPSFIVISMFTG